jgi:hypothetical protein
MSNDSVTIDCQGLNLDSINCDERSAESLNIDSVSRVIDAIDTNKLCVGGNTQDMFIFVNESASNNEN